MDRDGLFDWVESAYGTQPEFPWDDENAILRHQENNKWYGAVLRVGRDRLGLPGSGIVDVVNLKCDPLLIASLRTQPGFHPAWHMNKENWITVRLDGTVTDEQLIPLIELSYALTDKKTKKRPARTEEAAE